MLFQSSERMGSPGAKSMNSGISVVAIVSAPGECVGARSLAPSGGRAAPRVVLGIIAADAPFQPTRKVGIRFGQAKHVGKPGARRVAGLERLVGRLEQVLNVQFLPTL